MNIITHLILLFMLFLTSQSGIATTTKFTEQQYDVNHISLGDEIYGYDTTSNLRNCCQTPPSVRAQDSSILAFVSDFNVTKGAADRAKQVHSVLDPRAQRARTTAVTETKEGIRVISSSEPRLTPAQRAQLGKNEIEGVGVGHAEVTGVNAARGAGLTPTGAAASRPICPNCAGFLKDQGVNPLSPLK